MSLKKIACCILLIFFQFISFAQTTNSITILQNNITFTFTFTCDGGPCEYGQFVNGDYWVVPNTPNGKIKVTQITPEGEFNGAMVNPDLFRDSNAIILPFSEQKQGLLNTYSHYKAELNLMNRLPYFASAGESIYKIKAKNSGCGTSAITAGCVETATVLTILDEIPENRGATLFRPPFHGDWKPLYTIDKVKMDRLPRLPQVSNGNQGMIGGVNGFEKWAPPQVELYRGGFGEFHRATIPHAAQTPYAADQAKSFLENLTQVFGLESDNEKRPAVYSLLQKGIDNYAVFKMGVRFGSGAGQHLGKKPPITFFAAMYDDPVLLEEVRAIATDKELEKIAVFQEDSQIHMGVSGMPIWGDKASPPKIHWYFSRLYPKLDNQGSAADPYGYIDGPAGGFHPDPNQTRDRNYLGVAGGPLIGYAFLQHLMPWYKYAAGDPEILLWSDRMYTGYGIPDFDGGLWTKPDPVAPYDPNESSDCKPFKLYSTGNTDCIKYMETWGPDPDNLDNYIPHNGNPMTDGRMPQLHGTKVDFNRLPNIVKNYWDELRPCADPNNPNYPCEGLGSEIDDTLSNDTPIEPGEEQPNGLKIFFDKDKIQVTDTVDHSYLSIQIYTISGTKLTQKIGSGSSIDIAWKNTSYATGLYIYIVKTESKTYNGKLIINP